MYINMQQYLPDSDLIKKPWQPRDFLGFLEHLGSMGVTMACPKFAFNKCRSVVLIQVHAFTHMHINTLSADVQSHTHTHTHTHK